MRRILFASLTLCCLGACRGWESESPPVHLVPNMDTQEKGKAYRRDTSGLWADGRVMRPPVDGTVARGSLVVDDKLLTDGLDPEGKPSLKFPASIERTDALRARGQVKLQTFCAPCHGAQGDGNGTVATKGLLVPPPSFHDPRLKGMPVGQIYAAIKNGVNNGNMPPYAHQLTVQERWEVVAAVRQLQMQKDPTVAEEGGQVITVAAATEASAQHGEQLYAAKGCNACHSLDGTKKVGPSFKGLFGSQEQTSAGAVTVDDAYLRESILEPNAKVVAGYPPAMPKLPFTDIEVQSLILFIKAQQ